MLMNRIFYIDWLVQLIFLINLRVLPFTSHWEWKMRV